MPDHRRLRKIRVDPPIREKLCELLASGCVTRAEAARIAGVNYAAVRQWLEDRGIDPRKAREEYLHQLTTANGLSHDHDRRFPPS